MHVLFYRYIAQFQKESMPEATVVGNWGQIFHSPVKIGEGWAKCISHGFKFSVDPNLWYTFDGGYCVGWMIKHSFPASFSWAQYYHLILRGGASNLNQFGEEIGQLLRLPMWVLHLRYVALNLKLHPIKGKN